MTKPTRIWIDTEFNDFQGPLISIALVAESGPEFYQAVPCRHPTPWVAQHVIPVLDIEPIPMPWLRTRLHMYLKQFFEVHIIADWPEDIAHFCNALITGPGTRVATPPLTMEIRRDLDCVSSIPHNALADARAMHEKQLELERKA